MTSARYRRHPAEVTADRLAAAVDRWPEHFSARDRDMVDQIRAALEGIAAQQEESAADLAGPRPDIAAHARALAEQLPTVGQWPGPAAAQREETE